MAVVQRLIKFEASLVSGAGQRVVRCDSAPFSPGWVSVLHSTFVCAGQTGGHRYRQSQPAQTHHALDGVGRQRGQQPKAMAKQGHEQMRSQPSFSARASKLFFFAPCIYFWDPSPRSVFLFVALFLAVQRVFHDVRSMQGDFRPSGENRVDQGGPWRTKSYIRRHSRSCIEMTLCSSSRGGGSIQGGGGGGGDFGPG